MMVKKKLLSILLSLSMVFMLFAGMNITVRADAGETDISGLYSSSSGNYEITTSGSYYMDNSVNDSSTITVSQGLEVSIRGQGSSRTFTDVLIDCLGSNILTIENLYVNNNTNSGSSTTPGGYVATGKNLIEFAGGSNELLVKGTNLLETVTYVTAAGIHVPFGVSLTIDAAADDPAGTLYLYKYTQGAGVGGNANEANGTITFSGGNIFIKGSKTGPLVGNDLCTASVTVGDVYVTGGNLNLISKAQGAGIGGSRMSGAGNVYISDGNVTLITDYSASSIGAGTQRLSTAGANGNLYITGGSVKSMLMDNAWSSWGITSPDASDIHTVSTTNEQYIINDIAITADKTDGSDAVSLYTFDTSSLGASSFTVVIDGKDFYTGGLHQYEYSDCTLISGGGTIDNWHAVSDSNLYFYLTQEEHLLNVNGNYYLLNWDGSAFTTTSLTKATITSSTSLNAAQTLLNSVDVLEVSAPITVTGSDTFSVASGKYVTRAIGYSGHIIDVSAGCILTLNEVGKIVGNDNNTDIYLNNISGSDTTTYISLTAVLTDTLIIEVANPASGLHVARASTSGIQTVSISYIKYASSAYSIVAGTFRWIDLS